MTLKDKRIIMLLGPRFEDSEGKEPLDFLHRKGATVEVVSYRKGTLVGKRNQARIEVDLTLDEVRPEDYDAMIIPGGRAPANLRKHPDAVRLVREFARTEMPTAAICHGPQMLAAAGLLEGRSVTGCHSIKGEMLEAGARFIDQKVAIDGNFITSREPADIPDFNSAVEEALS